MADNKTKKIKLTDEDRRAIINAVYGEGAGADDAFRKMVLQTIINRYMSKRKKEFGQTVPEILQRGYYAVSNPNVPYKQAIAGKFPDVKAQAAYANTEKLVDSVLGDEDFGKAMFYFNQGEEAKMRKRNEARKKSGLLPVFNFDAVKPTGMVGDYYTYGY